MKNLKILEIICKLIYHKISFHEMKLLISDLICLYNVFIFL